MYSAQVGIASQTEQATTPRPQAPHSQPFSKQKRRRTIHSHASSAITNEPNRTQREGRDVVRGRFRASGVPRCPHPVPCGACLFMSLAMWGAQSQHSYGQPQRSAGHERRQRQGQRGVQGMPWNTVLHAASNERVVHLRLPLPSLRKPTRTRENVCIHVIRNHLPKLVVDQSKG